MKAADIYLLPFLFLLPAELVVYLTQSDKVPCASQRSRGPKNCVKMTQFWLEIRQNG